MAHQERRTHAPGRPVLSFRQRLLIVVVAGVFAVVLGADALLQRVYAARIMPGLRIGAQSVNGLTDGRPAMADGESRRRRCFRVVVKDVGGQPESADVGNGKLEQDVFAHARIRRSLRPRRDNDAVGGQQLDVGE